MNILNSLSWFLNSIQYSHSEHIVFHTLMYPVASIWQVLCQFSSLTISYYNLWFNSYSLTFLVPMSDSCRTPSHHTVLWKFHYSPFLTKFVILEIYLVYLVSLKFLSIHISYFIYNIMKGACYGTTYVSLFKNPLFSILKCDKAIPAVHAYLYSL